MALQERIPDGFYAAPPVHQTYGDVIRADARCRVNDEAPERIALSPELTRLNDKLRDTDTPVPAIAVRLSTVRGTKEFAQTYIAYGKTEPGEGLRPTQAITSNYRGGYRAKLELALPIDPASRGAVAYWPSSDWSQQEGSRIVGQWQHLRRDKFTTYDHGLEETTDYDDEVLFEDRPFTVWPTGFGHFSEGAPVVTSHRSDTRDEINRGIREVRSADARGDGVVQVRRGDTWHHTILVGRRAVRAALETLENQAPHGSELPRPLADMLAVVADGLSVPA